MKEKENNLIRLGLCEREYKPKGYKDKEKKYNNYDEERCEYYSNIPLDIDDEVYLNLLKTPKAKLMLQDEEPTTNVSSFCSLIAIIILIIGVIAGFIYAFEAVTISLLIWISTAVFVIHMFAMGKIVEYLHIISDFAEYNKYLGFLTIYIQIKLEE